MGTRPDLRPNAYSTMPHQQPTTLDEFADWTIRRWVPYTASTSIMILGLAGESGELVDELLIALAAKEGDTIPVHPELLAEMGDALFNWAITAKTFGFTPSELDASVPPASEDVMTLALRLTSAASGVCEQQKKSLRSGDAPNTVKLSIHLAQFIQSWQSICALLKADQQAIMRLCFEKIEHRLSTGAYKRAA